MRASSQIRRKHSFAPWLAALLMGASANAGWLIHELRDDHGRAPQVLIQLDRDQSHAVSAVPAEGRARTRTRTRQRTRERLPASRPAADLDLDLWIEQTDRYRYSIDRRALDRIAVAELDAGAVAQLDQLGVFARALTLAEPLELRNIQQGTQLWLLGLRNGDQLRSVAVTGEAAVEQVELQLLRRGRFVTIVYELS